MGSVGLWAIQKDKAEVMREDGVMARVLNVTLLR